MDTPTISVVIPTYQRREQVTTCVQAVLRDAGVLEVIAVIDGSTDGTAEALTALAESESRLIVYPLASNMGRSVARSKGVDLATGDVVLLLDDDVIARPMLASGHALHHGGSGTTVVVGYMPVDHPDGATGQLYAREYEAVTQRWTRDAASILPSLWGGNVSIDTKAARSLGLSSPGFENRYHEDTDFGLRCRDAQLTARFDRDLRAEHLHSRSLAAFLRDARERGAGLMLLRQRHGAIVPDPLPRFRILGSSIVVGMLTAVLSPLARLTGTVELFVARVLRRFHTYAGAVAFASTNESSST